MPSSPATALHRAAARLVRDFARARIPLPLPAASNDLAASLPARLATLRAAVPAGDLDAAFRTLRGLQSRLDFLAATEPRTRAALARWAALEEGEEGEGRAGAAAGAPAAAPDPFAQARAFAAGAALLPRVARPPALVTTSTGGGGAGDAPTAGPWAAAAADAPEDEDDDAGHAAAAAAAEAAVDALAAAAGGGAGDRAAPPTARVRALAAALHDGGGGGGARSAGGLRAAPVEWLYAGLAPLLPGPVAAARRGAPLGVAAVAAGVATRLGIPSLPAGLVVGGGPADGASAAAALARSLPPDRAARLAGRAASLASAPPGASDAWLLVCPQGSWAWDPSSGRVEAGGDGGDDSLVALAARAAGLSDAGATTLQPSIRLALGARRAWAALLRTAVVAHTRRGDSEAVAGVLPQVLALDADAEEWGMILPGVG